MTRRANQPYSPYSFEQLELRSSARVLVGDERELEAALGRNSSFLSARSVLTPITSYPARGTRS